MKYPGERVFHKEAFLDIFDDEVDTLRSDRASRIKRAAERRLLVRRLVEKCRRLERANVRQLKRA